MADVSVRAARAGDADRVAEVQLSTWRTAYGDLLPDEVLNAPADEVAAAWRAAVAGPPSPRHRLLVAMDGERLVGIAASAPAEDDDVDPGTTSELTALLVEPRWGRRGHGSRLLAATVEAWKGDGTQVAVAWLWSGDVASRGLLTSAGWDLDGAARGLDTGAGVQRQVRLHTSLADA